MGYFEIFPNLTSLCQDHVWIWPFHLLFHTRSYHLHLPTHRSCGSSQTASLSFSTSLAFFLPPVWLYRWTLLESDRADNAFHFLKPKNQGRHSLCFSLHFSSNPSWELAFRWLSYPSSFFDFSPRERLETSLAYRLLECQRVVSCCSNHDSERQTKIHFSVGRLRLGTVIWNVNATL